MVRYTKDWSDEDLNTLDSIADRLDATSEDMMSVMMAESGCKASAHNENGHASGLIQFMPKILAGLGWFQGHEAFRKLSVGQQLPFVEKFYKPYVGNLDTIEGLYVATFLPSLIKHSHEPEYVLVAKGGQLGWAYDANAVFDQNKDKKIVVHELGDAVQRNCQGPRWAEFEARLSGEGLDELTANWNYSDLGTIYGVQHALKALGYDPGPLDGMSGPKTRAAIKEFQYDQMLTIDGIYGPITRTALLKAADTKPEIPTKKPEKK